MRKKRRVLKNGANSKTEVTSSSEDLAASETVAKRKRVALLNALSNEIETESKSAYSSDENLALVSSPKNYKDDDESSDSSSNEFTKPDFSLVDMKNIGPKEAHDDFTAIEDNILADVGRLSESDESDLEEILPVPSPVTEEPKTNDSTLINKKVADASPLKSNIKDETEVKGKRGRRYSKQREKNLPKTPPKGSAKKGSSKRGVRNKKGVIKDEEEKKPFVDVNKMDVTQLLALGESVAESCKEKSISALNNMSIEEESNEEDWEEVDEDAEIKQEEKPHVIPKEGVEITLEAPDLFYRRKKKGIDMEACIRRRLNRNKRDIQVLIHKVHLLCWVAHGRYVNFILNSQNLMALGLSLIPSNHCYPPSRTDLDYLEKVVQWFRKTVPVVPPEKPESHLSLETSLEKQFQARKAHSKKDLVLMFVCMMRSLGIRARLILSLQPAPLKPPSHELCSIGPQKSVEGKNGMNSKGNPSKSSESVDLSLILEEGPSTSKAITSTTSEKTPNKETKVGVKVAPTKTASTDKKSGPTKKGNSKTKTNVKVTEKADVKASLLKKNEKSVSSPIKSRGQRCKKKHHYKESDSSDFEEVAQSKGKGDKKSTKGKVGMSKKEPVIIKKKLSSDEDSDFEPVIVSVQKGKGIKVEPKDRKVLSSNSESEEQGESSKTMKKKEGIDAWVEVFLEMEEKWISVDVPLGNVHCVVELHAKATAPVLYVLAFGNDMCLKDVSRRYCPQWLSVTQKKRVNERWWKRSLRSFLPRKNAFDRREEEEMDEELEARPLPTNITEYKSHPLYALKRHLLKFEAIYPPDAQSLGFIRGEAVYSRDCVCQLHSRETWLKEAKVVRLGEKPYKIVKARPKYDRMSGKVISDLPLELFGAWQVNNYIPPPAVDGKVPRNEYGNVDLYKPCMLPAGTVHLQLPALNRVAKKLQIDCAPAVVGFDFHSGGSHPTFDGFIVCEEFKDTLIDAWDQEQDEQEKRYREKKQKRVHGNWIRLVRGLLIRESLRHKYSFGEVGESSSGKKRKTSKNS